MPPTKKNKRNNFQKKMEDEKPKESECDVKRPSGPIFAFYYISKLSILFLPSALNINSYVPGTIQQEKQQKKQQSIHLRT